MVQQRMAVFLMMLLVAVGAATGPVEAQAAEAIPGEYLVKYKGQQSFMPMASIRSVAGVRILDHNAFGHLLKVTINPVDEGRTLARLMSDPNVEYVVANIKLHAFTAPVDMQALQDQWAIKKVNAEAAWIRAGNKGKRSIVVGLIDTGADYNHPNLAPNMVAGYNFHDNNSDPMDKTGTQNPGHGTHCAGIIGATGLIDGGTIGMSPEVSIMPLRFLGEDGSGDLNNGIKAIDYAIQKGVKVISASWGATVPRSQALPLIDAVKRADDAGVIFVVAAANDGRSNDTTEVFPTNAGYPNTISVAASGPNDEKPQWSNYGRRTVHVAAPGLDIMSTLPSNKYGKLSGTSMATPLVAGMVAFLASQDPTITGAQARALLQITGAKANIETACNCRVDAVAAVDTLISGKMFITPAAGTVSIGDTLTFTGTHGKAPFTYAVANGSIGSINSSGVFTGSSKGDTTVTVTDSTGATSTSLAVYVVDKSKTPPPDDGGGGGGGGGGDPGTCPIGNPQLCQIICQFQPDLPFCDKSADPPFALAPAPASVQSLNR